MRTKGAVSLKDIAERIGVSINTVSRALRDCSDISPMMKKEVNEVAFDLGYVPKCAYKDNSSFHRSVALVCNNIKEPIFAAYSDGLAKRLAKEGMFVTIFISETAFLDKPTMKSIMANRIDGIISYLEPTNEAFDISKANSIPLIVLGRKTANPEVNAIYFDDEKAGKVSAAYFAKKGLKKVLYVGIDSVRCSRMRQDGFTKEATKSGLTVLSVNSEEFSSMGEAVSPFIKEGIDGIFFFNDTLAYVAERDCSLKEKGIEVVGCDDTCSYVPSYPKMRSVSFPLKEIMNETVTYFLKMMNNPNVQSILKVNEVKDVKLNF